MRVLFAGLFVFAGLLAIVVVFSGTGWLDALSEPAFSVLSAASLFALLFAAMWLFNRQPLNLLGFKSPEEHLRELEEAGMIETDHFLVTRVFEVEETEDEGLHYFLQLRDGGVLYLTGQCLYDYLEITGDPEFNQPRRFPCTEFSVSRHRLDRYIVDIQCRGRVIEPERSGPPFSKSAWREKRVPEDGQTIQDRTFEELLAEFCHASPAAV